MAWLATGAGRRHGAQSPWALWRVRPSFSLERYVVVLFPGVLDGLVAQHVERAADPSARVAGQDHLIDVAAFGGGEGIGEAVLILLDARGDLRRVAKVRSVEDLDGSLRSHDRDLSGRPGVIDIAADVLGTHYVVGAAVGFARDHCNFWHRRLREREQQLGPVLDKAAVLLRRARQEARHIDKGDDGDLEAVTKAYKTRSLARRIRIEHARQHHRLVRDDADGASLRARKARDDVARKCLLDFEEVALIHHL